MHSNSIEYLGAGINNIFLQFISFIHGGDSVMMLAVKLNWAIFFLEQDTWFNIIRVQLEKELLSVSFKRLDVFTCIILS